MPRVFSFSTLAVCTALLVMASSALAGTIPVDYYTTGFFTKGSYAAPSGFSASFVTGATPPNGGPYTGVSSVTINDSNDSHSSTLTYNFSGLTPVSLPSNGAPLAVNLGDFTYIATDKTLDSYTGINFTLDVYQTVPGRGPGQLSAVLTGALIELSNGATGASLFVDYNPSTVVVNSSPAVQYSIDSYVLSNGAKHTGEDITTNPNDLTQVGAMASVVVPLPNTTGAGLTLLAGVVGFAAIRRRVLA